MKKGTWIAIIFVAALSVLIAISLMQMSPNPAISDKMNQSIAKIKVRYAMVNASEEFQKIVEEAADGDFVRDRVPRNGIPSDIRDCRCQLTKGPELGSLRQYGIS